MDELFEEEEEDILGSLLQKLNFEEDDEESGRYRFMLKDANERSTFRLIVFMFFSRHLLDRLKEMVNLCFEAKMKGETKRWVLTVPEKEFMHTEQGRYLSAAIRSYVIGTELLFATGTMEEFVPFSTERTEIFSPTWKMEQHAPYPRFVPPSDNKKAYRKMLSASMMMGMPPVASLKADFLNRLASVGSRNAFTDAMTRARYDFRIGLAYSYMMNETLRHETKVAVRNTKALLEMLDKLESPVSPPFADSDDGKPHVPLTSGNRSFEEIAADVLDQLPADDFGTVTEKLAQFVERLGNARWAYANLPKDDIGNFIRSWTLSTEGRNFCLHCGKLDEDPPRLLLCQRCEISAYCNQKCQKAHYILHARVCKLILNEKQANLLLQG